MRNAWGGLFTASVGLLLVSACSGASSTNLLGPPVPGSGDDASNSVGRDATLDGSSPSEASNEDAPSPIIDGTTGDDAAQGDDGQAADGADASSDGPPADSSLVTDGGADVWSDASAGDGGGDSSVQDARVDAADTFPCGPTRTCHRATEYCFVLNVVAILDSAAGPNYSCQPLPVCDSSDECSCIDHKPLICTCSESNGHEITDTCSG